MMQAKQTRKAAKCSKIRSNCSAFNESWIGKMQIIISESCWRHLRIRIKMLLHFIVPFQGPSCHSSMLPTMWIQQLNKHCLWTKLCFGPLAIRKQSWIHSFCLAFIVPSLPFQGDQAVDAHAARAPAPLDTHNRLEVGPELATHLFWFTSGVEGHYWPMLFLKHQFPWF